MKRRGFIAVLLAMAAPTALGGETIPVQAVEHIPTRPAEWPAKVMKWACVCLKHGAHWTIGAIRFAAATLGQVRHHLVSVHGHNYAELAGLDKEALGNLHDAHHEGRRYGNYHFPATPANGVDHLSSCPGGNCPVQGAPRRRTLFRFFGD